MNAKLQHYGILGMRWGRRKGGSSGVGKKTRHPASEDHLEKVKLKKRKLHTMSNAEIEKLNKRLQLEKNYKELTRSQLGSGKNMVSKLLINAAAQGTANFISSGLATGFKILAK